MTTKDNTPTEFDKELERILTHHSTSFRSDSLVGSTVRDVETAKAIKQAVDKYVIGESNAIPPGDVIIEGIWWERLVENRKMTRQRQSLWNGSNDMEEKVTSKLLDTDLLRLLSRYAEAYFSETGENISSATDEIEGLIFLRETTARIEELESLERVQGLYKRGNYIDNRLSRLRKEIK